MPTRPTRNDMIFRIESALAEVAQYAGSARNHERIMSAAGVGIDQSAYPILHQLSRRSSARISDLAIDLNLHVSTVSRQVQQVEVLGLVERAGNGRLAAVQLTDKGRAVFEVVRAARHRLASEMFEDWSAAELQQCMAVVDRIVVDLIRSGAEPS